MIGEVSGGGKAELFIRLSKEFYRERKRAFGLNIVVCDVDVVGFSCFQVFYH